MSAAGQAAKLVERGFTNASVLVGGVAAWERAGFPLESSRRRRRRRGGDSLILRVIDRLSTRQWIAAWLLMIGISGLAYWALCGVSGHGLESGGQAIDTGWSCLRTSMYFSVVTATSLGYGDVVPVGFARFLAITEAAAGMLLFGAIIAKLLSHRQEVLIDQIHRLTFEERLGRMQNSLHLSIAEFHSASEACARQVLEKERIETRMGSAALLLERDVRAVRDLLHAPEKQVRETLLESILVTLSAALGEFAGVVRLAAEHEVALAPKVLRSVSRTAREICSECVPASYTEGLRSWMDRIQSSADAIERETGADDEKR